MRIVNHHAKTMLSQGGFVHDSTKPPNDHDDAILFEQIHRLFFGDKATRITWQANHPTHRRNWFRRVCRLIYNRIESLDTTPRHKESLLSTVSYASKELTTATQPTWRLVLRLLALTGKLLGYGGHRRTLRDLVSYWQQEEQAVIGETLIGSHGSQRHDDEKDVISVRKKMVGLLKKKGYSDIKIARILQISQDEAHQLRPGQK